eukprot:m.155106 g.155106  ORF g.155106 m.155106 type:complete len:486 (-) comp30924_c0_seq6:110-1567(-)
MCDRGLSSLIMIEKISLITIVLQIGCLAASFTPAFASDNGLARTPPMGWSSWSMFKSDITDKIVRESAMAMVKNGMKDAGYEYIMVDDGWYSPGRNASGHLVVDPLKFPDLAATVQFVHSLGLKVGLWYGHGMCVSLPEKASTLVDDVNMMASYGIDAVKHDECSPSVQPVTNTTSVVTSNLERFERFAQALNATGRHILFDVVMTVSTPLTMPSTNYGAVWSPVPYTSARIGSSLLRFRKVANLWWSLPLNKYDCWYCCVKGMTMATDLSPCINASAGAPHNGALRGLLPMLDAQDSGSPGFPAEGHWSYGGPGGWNHLDQLAVGLPNDWQGPGFTPIEQKTQMVLWAILASPLIVAFDVRSASPTLIALATQPHVLAILNDPQGTPGYRLSNIGVIAHTATSPRPLPEAQVWVRPLCDNRLAVALFNRCDGGKNIEVLFTALPGGPYTHALDVWTGNTSKINATDLSLSSYVTPHGTAAYILS